LTLGNEAFDFDILPNHKTQLIEGRDDIDLTLRHRSEIDAWVAADQTTRPWAKPRR
jgi:3-isopropylmalate dehydratase small subunit